MASSSAKRIVVKLMLLGDYDSGCSQLWHRLVGHEGEIKPGVDFATKIIPIGENSVHLQIWHTAGQERFRSITSSYYRGAQLFALVYSVANQASFDHLQFWLAEANSFGPEWAEKLIIGLDQDVLSRREVDYDSGRVFGANENVKFVEAKLDNLEEVNDEITAMVTRMVEKMQDPNRSGLRLASQPEPAREEAACGC